MEKIIDIIEKNGFFIIDKNTKNNITIKNNLDVIIFTRNTSKEYNIDIGENCKIKFFGFFNNKSPSKIFLNQNKDNSFLETNILFHSKKNDLKTNIKSYINSNFSSSNMEIVSLIFDKKIDIDSTIEIEKGLKKVSGFLNIQNILLGEKGSVKGLPTLLVRSNDVKAGHSCKIYRLDNSKIFYLKSRGLDDNICTYLMIESYFEKIFGGLKDINNEIYKKIKNTIKKD